jgi:hypothetical protein
MFKPFFMQNIKIFFSISFSFLLAINVSAQSAIEDIRAHYKTIGKQIATCKQKKIDKPCSLYSNMCITNAGDLSWRASGNHKKEVQFWYEDSPRYCDECGKEGINVLKKVISSEQTGLTTTYKEWLYKAGNLIFYYIKISGEQTEEYRYYYQNDKLIKHIEAGNTLDGDEAAKIYGDVILQKGKSLQQQFLISFR